MNNLKQRRTIRKYSSEDISETFLTQLLTEAERTPTMGNLQLYSVVISRNSEMKRRLAPAHFNQPMVESAPVVLTFCADSRRTTLWAHQRKGNPGYNNFLSFVNAAADALLYCQTFCNLAEEKGLGTCFLGTTFYNPLSIVETLALPRLVMPVGTITLAGLPNLPTSLNVCRLKVSSTPKPIAITLPSSSTGSMPKRNPYPPTASLSR